MSVVDGAGLVKMQLPDARGATPEATAMGRSDLAAERYALMRPRFERLFLIKWRPWTSSRRSRR